MKHWKAALLLGALAMGGCSQEPPSSSAEVGQAQAFELTPAVIAMRWQWLNPDINSFTFRETKNVFEFRDVGRGGEVWELPRADTSLMPAGYAQFAERSFTNAMLVL